MKRLWKPIALWLVCLVMVSCSSSETSEEPLLADEGKVSFAFHLLTVDEPSSHTRTVKYIGSDFDARIKKGTLHIFIYEGQRRIGEVEALKYYPEPDANGGVSAYFVQGVSSVVLKPERTYRLLVVANVSDLSSLAGEGPTFEVDQLRHPDGYLPLWGVTSHQVDHAPIQYLAPITLLRGAAKVVVKLSDPLKRQGYVLKDVVLRDVAPVGYAFPRLWKDVAFTQEMTAVADYFHPFEEASAVHPFSLQPTADGDYFAYVPEYVNIGKKSPADISLSVVGENMEQRFEHAIAFQTYREGVALEGTLHDIIRNHVYEYQIQEVRIGHQLILESLVHPWILEEETWDYTDQVTVRAEGKMQWVKDTYQRIDRETGAVVMIPGTTMVCTFQIDTPKEAHWYASFIPVSGATDAFAFETNSINGGKNATGEVGKPATLHIQSVRPASNENNVALLRIVVLTKGGQNILVKNLLPDEFQEIMEYTVVQSK